MSTVKTNITYSTISNEIMSFINNDIKLFTSYDYNKVINTLSPLQINLLISNLLHNITNISYDNKASYKYTNYWDMFVFIINIIINIKSPFTLYDFELLLKLSILNNGHTLLEKIKPLIVDSINKNILTENYIINFILFNVFQKGTLPIFFFWRKFINNTNIHYTNNYESYLCHACLNNDIRIFKFLINKEQIPNKSIKLDNDITIGNIFTHLFDIRNSNKKKMVILKELNNYIKLDKYFTDMLKFFDYSLKSFKVLSKYYYKAELSFAFMYDFLKSNYIYNIETVNEIYQDIYSYLKYPNEKYYYLIIKNLLFKHITKEDINIFDDINFINIINKNKNVIMELIFKLTIKERYSNDLISYIIKYYSDNRYIHTYINYYNLQNYSNNYKNIWYYSRFFTPNIANYDYNYYKNIILYNKILHKLRCIAKKKKNIQTNKIRLTMAPVLNEIENFTPNKNISILMKGSVNYQIDKQKFTKLPPRHILPFELSYLENCLIKEKSDGINVDKLPNNIYPFTDIIDNDIKAEYIEELDLYLVYDINIPNMDILERQSFLRNIHSYTCKLNNLQNINTFEELLNNIEYERTNLKSFLKINNNIKWYPKASFKINKFDNNLILNMTQYIQEVNTSINKYINKDGIIKNDGFIITPLNNNQELKLKPISLLTIDLLYKNNTWVDSNNIKHLDIICNNPKENKIYRCYPNITSSTFIAKEIRYDKKNPNTNKICNLLKTLVNFNWLKISNINNNYYQKNNKVNNHYIRQILQDNKNIFINNIKKINPKQNKCWLDLGCGSCKFFNDLKIYNPKKYLGIDIDIKNTIKAHNKYNEYNIFQIYNCDLSVNWEETNYKIIRLDNTIKYDYIFCNFSLMHFSTDLFWHQLDKVTSSGSIFLFNLTLDNTNWIYNDSYLKSNNIETELYFEWIHDKPIRERLVSNLEITNIIEKYNWSLINKEKYNNNLLIKCYEWYTIIKK